MNYMKFINKQKAGFSMVEVIVAMTIMAVVITVSLANYSGGNDLLKVKTEAHKLVSEIRKTQIKALGSVEYSSDTPEGGWGIYINLNENNDRFRIFANTNYNDGANLEYDAGEGDSENGGELVLLGNDVQIASTSVGNVLNITFVPPDPTVNIYDGSATTTSVKIALKYEDIVENVVVNYFGLIEVVE